MPNPNTYKKKEIIDPERFCKLKECRRPFTATRQNQMFHNHQCAEKQWRLDHPRTFFHKPPTWRSRLVKDPRRDKPEQWLNYMQENPEYFNCIFSGQTVKEVFNSIDWVSK